MENFTPNIAKKIAEDLDPSTKEYRNDLANTLAEVRNISPDAAQAYLEKTQGTDEYQQALEEIKSVRGDAIELKNELLESQTELAHAQEKHDALRGQFSEGESKREGLNSVEQALEIMGESQFIGPDDIEKTFGFQPDTIPEIQFSSEELERAKELGQKLILYVDMKEDGTDFVVGDMKETLPEKTQDGGKFFYNDWYDTDEITSKETPRAGWRLTTPEVIETSTNKNYLEQTEELITYLENEVFAGEEMPQEYIDALEEFKILNTPDFKEQVTSSTESEWKKAAQKLSALSINQMTRENFSEIIYRLACEEKKSGTRETASTYSWSNSLGSDGMLVRVGHFDADGLNVGRWLPVRSNSRIGVCFSRSV